jgi:hypothetical protein
MLSILVAALLSLIPQQFPSPRYPARTALASRYADTRKDEGGTPACWKRMPDDVFNSLHPIRCAHRTYKCGTLVKIVTKKTKQVGFCAVLDSGPWCSRGPGCQRVGAPYRGDLDLSPIPADSVGLKDGRVMVDYTVVHWGWRWAAREKTARR